MWEGSGLTAAQGIGPALKRALAGANGTKAMAVGVEAGEGAGVWPGVTAPPVSEPGDAPPLLLLLSSFQERREGRFCRQARDGGRPPPDWGLSFLFLVEDGSLDSGPPGAPWGSAGRPGGARVSARFTLPFDSSRAEALRSPDEHTRFTAIYSLCENVQYALICTVPD